MARLRRKGAGSTILIQDDDGRTMPVVPQGNRTDHILAPTESTAARNTTSFDGDCGLVLVLVSGYAHMALGGSSVAATTSSQLIPPGAQIPVPLMADDDTDADYISIISASGSGDIQACLTEAC